MACDNCSMVSCEYCCFKDNYTEHVPDLIRNAILDIDKKGQDENDS